jgi:hypothetical protein
MPLPPAFRNTIDEQKSNYGSRTYGARDVGRHNPISSGAPSLSLPEIGGGQSLSESVNEALKGTEGMARDKADRIDESVKVTAAGEDQDLHEKAAAKQP